MKHPDPDNDAGLPPDLQQLGARIQSLKKEDAPKGLASRTAARIEGLLPERTGTKALEALKSAGRQSRRFAQAITSRLELLPWWRRPTYNPLARLAAVVLLLVTISFLAHEPTAERVGRAVERVIGKANTERLEVLVDHILPANGSPDLNDPFYNELSNAPAMPVNHKIKAGTTADSTNKQA